MLVYELEVETTCLLINKGPAQRGVRINPVEVYPSTEANVERIRRPLFMDGRVLYSWLIGNFPMTAPHACILKKKKIHSFIYPCEGVVSIATHHTRTGYALKTQEVNALLRRDTTPVLYL